MLHLNNLVSIASFREVQIYHFVELYCKQFNFMFHLLMSLDMTDVTVKTEQTSNAEFLLLDQVGVT